MQFAETAVEMFKGKEQIASVIVLTWSAQKLLPVSLLVLAHFGIAFCQFVTKVLLGFRMQ